MKNMNLQKLEEISNLILSIEENDVHFTGERVVVGRQIKEQDLSVLKDHLARYRFACNYVMGKDVLDAACGTGYGTAMLKMIGANNLTGVDISEETVQRARQVYGNMVKGIDFITGSVVDLPFNNESFDIVISFETIEHVDNPSLWIKESSRVLRKNGYFIVSTPNRKVTNPGLFFQEKVFNPFHKKEFSLAEFLGELLVYYDVIELYGQNFAHHHEIQSINIIRSARGLPVDRIPLSSKMINNGEIIRNELIPFKECVNFEPEYITAVLRKK